MKRLLNILLFSVCTFAFADYAIRVNVPNALIKVETVKAETIKVETAKVETARTTAAVAETVAPANVKADEVAPEKIKIADAAERLPQMAKMQKSLSKIIDRRNLTGNILTLDNPDIVAWSGIYAAEPLPIKFNNAPDHLLMVAEAHVPLNSAEREKLETSLAHYKSIGFDSVLFVIDPDRLIVDEIKAALTICKSSGLKIWIAYGGGENIWSVNIFQAPDKIRAALEAAAQFADGLFLCWRRTSAHLFSMDPHFAGFLADCVQRTRPDLPVIGEAYYGETFRGRRKFDATFPDGCAGVLINGLGVYGVNVEGVLSGMLKDFSATRRYVTIVGEPYGTTFLENKIELGSRWLRAGCAGLVVLHGSGTELTDNLCK